LHKFSAVVLFGAVILAAGCGSGNGGSNPPPPPPTAGCTTSGASSQSAAASNTAIAVSAPNVASLIVDGGPKNNYANGLFTTVTVCVPGTVTGCQTIDHVLVDTGSFGLRLLVGPPSSAAGGQLTLALPAESDGVGPLAECAQFSDGITWGAIRKADIYIGGPNTNNMSGEVAPNVPMQVIGDSSVGAPPSGCTKFGTPEDTLSTLLANGILGVGPYPQDCGNGCVTSSSAGLYYHCPSSGCVESAVSLDKQVINPVAAFVATGAGVPDNNGVIVELPAIGSGGAATVSGSLVFGIGTQSNNGLGGATVYTADPSTGNITTVFAQKPYSNSFIDSGSNGYFFLNSTSTNIPTCTSNSNAPGFYCPTTTLSCSAVNQGTNGTQGTVNFTVANANSLVQTGNSAFDDLAGPNNPPPNPGGGSPPPTGFDWGLPFFYGRNVYTGIAGMPDANGNPQQPFFAY